MYFFEGLIRSTVLYLAIRTLINHSNPISFIMLYAILSLIHFAICRLSHTDMTAGDIFIGALQHDLIAPFLGVLMFIEHLLEKLFTRSTEKSIFEVEMQIYVEGIWGLFILFSLISGFRR